MHPRVGEVLRGKKQSQSSHLSVDTGDYVIVINAEKIVVSGKEDGAEAVSHPFLRDTSGGFKTANFKGNDREEAR